ncbi:glycoside hydrolase family 13 protein [Pseudomarimonas salicorniae]|uniref:Glycoside hydrolase family 13 protein n=1 Tax=Pseudomarimonas salicorniae TaxID=2933270 RepID=A0ABT0GLX9_9GAMM|nr:glycoside hydrolase family 13 protein [Lysobacter sp. CAU 1642]MCK7595552.1 glycoside hydrolase family 13 protein [Lysobacter sp. CAU 1642]
MRGVGWLGLLLWPVLAVAQGPTVERVDPPHWWTGMAERQVQLMVYGKGVGGLNARVLHRGVSVTGIQRGHSRNYLFIDLHIGAEAEPGVVRIDFVGDTRTIGGFDYTLKARGAGSAQRQGFGPKDLIYLVVPDRFANGDPGNDVVPGLREARVDRSDPGARHGGDLAGMTGMLDYLAGLGVTQVWPTPLVENDMPAYSYHGYAFTDGYRIDPRFGSHQDYLNFVAAARKRGIGVIQDIVLNHIGSQHPWIADPPTRDWINAGGQFSPTSHVRSTVQDPYAAEIDRRDFADGWFVETMPDLNQRQPLLASWLIQNSIWWIEEAGLSGIREDTYPYADAAFLSEWARRIRAEYPRINLVGEEWSRNPVIVSHWQAGSRRSGHEAQTPSMMDFPLHYALLDALGAGRDGTEAGWMRAYEALANDVIYPAPEQLVLFEGNHDTPRLYSLLDEDLDLWKQAITFLLTSRRVPQVFYGTEVLMRSPKARNDGLVRSDFPGGWRDDAVSAVEGRGLDAKQREAQDFLRRLARFRKGAPALHEGSLIHFVPQAGVYVYARRHARQSVLVILSQNPEPVELPLGRYAEVLGEGRRGIDVLSGRPFVAGEALSIPALGLGVLAFDGD